MKRRNTATKEAVLELLTQTGKAMNPDAMVGKIKSQIDRATVYRVLNRFCEDGVVHKIVAEDGKQYFAICRSCEERKSTGYHSHFRCTNCQTIECLQDPIHFAVPQGYRVENVNCVLSGLCQECS